jgi:hypothetical protein
MRYQISRIFAIAVVSLALMLGCNGGGSGPTDEEEICGAIDEFFFEVCDTDDEADRQAISDALAACGVPIPPELLVGLDPGDIEDRCVPELEDLDLDLDGDDVDDFQDALDTIGPLLDCRQASVLVAFACQKELPDIPFPK